MTYHETRTVRIKLECEVLIERTDGVRGSRIDPPEGDTYDVLAVTHNGTALKLDEETRADVAEQIREEVFGE